MSSAPVRVVPSTWSERVRAAEKVSPWPGPRPLTEDDAESDLLIGRRNDVVEFINNITFARLTHLIGVSGVGKSSLLMAGIVPQLRRDGYVIASCRTWNQLPGEDFDVFLARMLHASLPAEDQSRYHANTDIFYDLHEQGSRAVIVLDQFEELVRHNKASRAEVFDFLADLISGTDISVVLSYRSEYSHLIQAINEDQRIESKRKQELQPIESGAGLTLIQSPRLPQGGSWTDLVTEDAATQVHATWVAACEADSRDHVAIGLLHLQGLLYVLFRLADGGIIDKGVWEAFLEAARAADAVDPARVMGFALEESATARLQLANEVAADLRMDAYLVRGTGLNLARIVPQLSSGGYKLEREAVDLVDTVLGEDARNARREIRTRLELAGLETRSAGVVARRLVECAVEVMTSAAHDAEGADSLLAARRARITDAVRDRYRLSVGEANADSALAEADDALLEKVFEGLAGSGHTSAASGPLLGFSATTAFVEQLRRFAWALTWLSELNLARLNLESTGAATVTLVHDGFGEPLDRWAERYEETHETWALFSISTPEGEQHEWGAGYDEDLSGADDRVKLHVNLGLPANAIIGGTFRDVVFVNCDFKGTAFIACTFVGVTFLNCALDGALFLGCTIAGGDEDVEDGELDGAAPSYLLRSEAAEMSQVLALYAEADEATELLVSRPPGQRAEPTADATAGLEWRRARNGLTIRGCRLSALSLLDLKFRDGARLQLSAAVGSGLQLKVADSGDDGSGPRLDFTDSIVRHASITGTTAEGRELAVTVKRSQITQWWVGSALVGTFDAADSQVVQLWVQAEGVTAATDAASVVAGTVNVAADASADLDGDGAAAARESFDASAARLDAS